MSCLSETETPPGPLPPITDCLRCAFGLPSPDHPLPSLPEPAIPLLIAAPGTLPSAPQALPDL